MAELNRLQAKAQGTIDAWIRANAKDVTDAGEADLIRRLRGFFRNPKNLKRMFGRLSTLVNADVESSLLTTIPTIERTALVGTKATEAFALRNAQLITKLGDAQVARVTDVIKNGAGMHVKALQKAFQEGFDVTESKAKLWARDQTLKLHAEITQERHQAVGIERYYWTDSNDERVREVHAELGDASDTGTTYAYKDPPIMSEDGRRGNPGEDFQCRCTAYPLL